MRCTSRFGQHAAVAKQTKRAVPQKITFAAHRASGNLPLLSGSHLLWTAMILQLDLLTAVRPSFAQNLLVWLKSLRGMWMH